jgi:hypothetical protein
MKEEWAIRRYNKAGGHSHKCLEWTPLKIISDTRFTSYLPRPRTYSNTNVQKNGTKRDLSSQAASNSIPELVLPILNLQCS